MASGHKGIALFLFAMSFSQSAPLSTKNHFHVWRREQTSFCQLAKWQADTMAWHLFIATSFMGNVRDVIAPNVAKHLQLLFIFIIFMHLCDPSLPLK
jgi:hypothetical protein